MRTEIKGRGERSKKSTSELIALCGDDFGDNDLMDYEFQPKSSYKDLIAGGFWLAGIVLGIVALVIFH